MNKTIKIYLKKNKVKSKNNYLKERNHLWDKFSRISRILAKFAKLNPREKSSENQFTKINPREFF